MAFQSVPQTAEIVVRYTGQGSNMVNVMAARLVGGYSLSDVELLAGAVDAVVGLQWLAIQTDEVTYVQTNVRGLELINDVEAVNDDNTGPGALTAVGLPGNATVAIKKQSGLTGRSARGRLYWIGLTNLNLQVDKNKLDAVAVNAIEFALEATRTAILGVGWTPVIVSRFLDGVLRPTGATFNWINTEAVNFDVDSQRRRLL